VTPVSEAVREELDLPRPSPLAEEAVLSVRGVSRKFSKGLKHSMIYGLADLLKSLFGIPPERGRLRDGEFWAVDDVGFELKKGEALGIVGANGCGKTTLLRLIAGILPPDKGEIILKGRVASLISLGTAFHPLMTGRENIYLNGVVLGMSREEIDAKLESIIAFSELGDFIDTPVSHYSSGMRVRLGFSIAISVKPDILLLDEILAVGDQSFKAKCYHEIDKISKTTAIVFISHAMPKITRISTRVMVLAHGREVFHSEDVRAGVDHYYSQFAIDKASVSGLGKAQIREVSLSSDQKLEPIAGVFALDYLDTLEIIVTFSIDPSIPQALMKLYLFDQEFDEVSSCFPSLKSFQIVNDADVLRVKARIPQVPLSPGLYYLTVAILSAEEKMVLTKSHSIKYFQVTGPFNSTAPTHLPAEWSLETQNGASRT